MDKTAGKLDVNILSPYQTFYKGTAISVSGKNSAGAFDVLFNHSNFFSLLPAGMIQINTGFETIYVEITNGFMRVSNNHVTLFANV